MSDRTPATDVDAAVPPEPPAQVSVGDVVALRLHGWAHGGESVGRLPSGMACFVAYAIPGETVRVQITRRKKRWARGRLLEVLEPSEHRVSPPCPHFGPDRCGGCQLQHIAPAHQLTLKAQVLHDQLVRLGGVQDPPAIAVRPVPGGWPTGYRAWARMAVAADGRLGFRSAGSHAVHAVDRCQLMTPAADLVRQELGDGWVAVREVELMAGEGGATAVLHPEGDQVPPVPVGEVGLAVQGAARVPAPLREPGRVHLRVGALSLQVSAGAFFQAGPATALALAELVVAAAEITPGDRVLDLYAGGGLLTVFLAKQGAGVTAVESDPVALADAAVNVAGLEVDLIAGDVAAVLADPSNGAALAADVIVLDPPRAGAGAQVCAQLCQIQPRRIVYVACDPASLARDTRVLMDAGYDLVDVVGLDAFGHTAHVEAVATFDRSTRSASS